MKFMFIFSILLSFNSFANSQCYNQVMDGNVEFKYKKNDRVYSSRVWQSDNAYKLCNNAESSYAPIRCFKGITGGQIEWARGKYFWYWKNIIDLCAGTNNSKATISCFKFENKIKGKGWREAIRNCSQSY